VTITITMLGGFSVFRDGDVVPAERWRRRQAAALVKLLALAPGRRLHREQVIDTLWPDGTLTDGATRLHKAAHFARRALDDPRAVMLRAELVELLPDATVVVDAVEFEARAVAALRGEGDRSPDPSTDGSGAVIDAYTGVLLPEDPYEEWVEVRRTRLAQLHGDLLRRAGRWGDLAAADPTDEHAQLQLMAQLVERGDLHGALRQFERLDRALSHELGVGPSPDALRVRDELVARASVVPVIPAAEGEREIPAATRTGGPAQAALARRATELARVRARLDEAAAGRGGVLVVAGAPGMGKSSLLAWIRDEASAAGWRTGAGLAAAVEGQWAYAPVLEALADLCRRQPTLLDGLDDAYRMEIDRALDGGAPRWHPDEGHQRLFIAVAELVRLAGTDRGLVLVIDDLHDADDASVRLVHYLARCAATERVLLVLAHRPVAPGTPFDEVRASLVGRVGVDLELGPLPDAEADALVRRLRPDLGDDQVSEIIAVAAGVPFALA
jgi:DNA-binding SARP family transcriptional activator